MIRSRISNFPDGGSFPFRFVVIVFFTLVSFLPYTVASDVDSILAGLDEKNIEVRKKFIEMSSTVDDPRVFDKLLTLLRVENDLWSFVFSSLHGIEKRFPEKFSSRYASAMKDEILRLKTEYPKDSKASSLAELVIDAFQENPNPSFDSVATWLMENSAMLTNNFPQGNSNDEFYDRCLWYFSLRNNAKAIKEVVARYKDSDYFRFNSDVIVFFTKKCDNSIIEPAIKHIHDDDSAPETFLLFFEEYANKCNRRLSDELVQKIKRIKKKDEENPFK